MEEKLKGKFTLSKQINGEIEIYYEWSPFKAQSIKISLNNESNKIMQIESLAFKLLDLLKNPGLIINLIDEPLILKDIFSNEKDISDYNQDTDKKDFIHTYLGDLDIKENTTGIPLFIKIQEWNNEKNLKIIDYEKYTKKEDKWIKKKKYE